MNEHAKHAELSPDAAPQPAQPQFSSPFAANLLFPESVDIKMEDASALNDYELGLFISSTLASAFVGFLVAWLQATDSGRLYLVLAVICLVIGGAVFLWALSKRKKMTRRSRTLKMRVSSIEDAPVNGTNA
jgi:hypothetical protein